MTNFGRSRVVVLVSFLALVALFGCDLSRRRAGTEEAEGPAKYGDDSLLATRERSFSPGATSPTDASPAPGTKALPKARTTTGTNAFQAGECTEIQDDIEGKSASRGLLAPSPYREIVIEIDYVGDTRKPSSLATSHLAATLKAITGKEIVFKGGNLIPQEDAKYSRTRILNMSAKRGFKSASPSAALWIAYLNGRSDENVRSLGVALGGTIAALFPDSWKEQMTSGKVTPQEVEKTVLLHEVGHLLSMVALDYPDIRKHQDPQHPGHHSRNRDSVMYWAAEDLSVENIYLGRSAPDRFDADDLADMRDLAACKL